jgi:hypothetical protein
MHVISPHRVPKRINHLLHTEISAITCFTILGYSQLLIERVYCPRDLGLSSQQRRQRVRGAGDEIRFHGVIRSFREDGRQRGEEGRVCEYDIGGEGARA